MRASELVEDWLESQIHRSKIGDTSQSTTALLKYNSAIQGNWGGPKTRMFDLLLKIHPPTSQEARGLPSGNQTQQWNIPVTRIFPFSETTPYVLRGFSQSRLITGAVQIYKANASVGWGPGLSGFGVTGTAASSTGDPILGTVERGPAPTAS